MGWNFSKGLMLMIGSIWMLGACSTAPMQSSRKGLFEQDRISSRSTTKKTIMETVGAGTLANVTLPGVWQWPLKEIEISSPYGERGSKFHQGVDLRAHVGTPVEAASDGEVVYVGSKIKGYGRMVVLKHRDGFFTVYAHHSKNKVKIGERVKAGQVIAYSGKSGRAIGAHLHFELRRGAQSIDPEYAFNGHLKIPANRKIASRTKVKVDYEE